MPTTRRPNIMMMIKTGARDINTNTIVHEVVDCEFFVSNTEFGGSILFAHILRYTLETPLVE